MPLNLETFASDAPIQTLRWRRRMSSVGAASNASHKAG
jgi:hypothetical protein